MSSTDDRIRIICDDRGRHNLRTIEWWSREDDGQWLAWVHSSLGNATLGQRHKRGGVARNARGWEFECPACRRNVRISHALVVDVLERLEAAGLLRIDLTTLDLLASNGSHVM